MRTPDPISSWRVPDPSLVLGDPRLLINLPRNWHSQRSLISRLNTCQLLSWVQPICNSMGLYPFHTVHVILKARILKWFSIPFSSGPHLSLTTNLDSILKSRGITMSTKVHLVKAMVSPVVTYGCESWTIKKAEHRRIDTFGLWCWRRFLRVPWTARR